MPSPNSDIVIADRLSDTNQVRIRGTTGLTVSWELSRAGQLACEIPLRDLAGYGLRPLDLLSRWVHYEHPTAGAWGGIITNVSPSDGIVSIGAESWAAAYRGVGTTEVQSPTGWMLVNNLVTQIDKTMARTGIRRGTFDVAGGDVRIQDEVLAAGTDIYESFLPSVLERWNATKGWRGELHAAGWNIDPLTRQLSFDATYGTDRSGSVALIDGYHNTSAEFSDDTTDIFNTIRIAGKINYRYSETVKYLNQKGKKQTKQITRIGQRDNVSKAWNPASIARHGEHMMTLAEDHPSAVSMDSAASQRAFWMARNQQNVSIECADVGGIWRNFREGDILWASLANEGAQGKMVARIRALNVSRGVMVVAGEAELA